MYGRARQLSRRHSERNAAVKFHELERVVPACIDRKILVPEWVFISTVSSVAIRDLLPWQVGTFSADSYCRRPGPRAVPSSTVRLDCGLKFVRDERDRQQVLKIERNLTYYGEKTVNGLFYVTI